MHPMKSLAIRLTIAIDPVRHPRRPRSGERRGDRPEPRRGRRPGRDVGAGEQGGAAPGRGSAGAVGDHLGRHAPMAEQCGAHHRDRPGSSPPVGYRARSGSTSHPSRRPGSQGGLPDPHPGRRPGHAGGARRRQRRPRRALRRRPALARAAHETGEGVAAGGAQPGLGTQVPAPRPPAGLSPQDQFLRRLGPAAVGALHPRAGRLRDQRHRADPTPIRR